MLHRNHVSYFSLLYLYGMDVDHYASALDVASDHMSQAITMSKVLKKAASLLVFDSGERKRH